MLAILEYFNQINPEDTFPLFEIRFLSSDRYGMTIEYDPSRDRIGDDYFKVYQGTRLKMKGEGQTPRARISLFGPNYVVHNDNTGEPKWELDAKDKRNLMSLLNEPNPEYPMRNNWR